MKQETVKSFEKRMKTIIVPNGFEAMWGEDAWPGESQKQRYFQLVKLDDAKIKFDIYGGGHTFFKTERGSWLSFDRTGVEDSFYHRKLFDSDNSVYDLNAIVAEQLKRIAERREYYKTAIDIPSIPFTVAPDGVEGLKQTLKQRGHLTFTPSGFGTGYNITKKPIRRCQYGEHRAAPELEAFLGHSPLYVSSVDCD